MKVDDSGGGQYSCVMSLFRETWCLIRAGNCLLASMGVLVGSYMTAFHFGYYGPVVTALSAFLICAGGNVVNDLVDLEIDRINRPRRVLVRGAVTKSYAVLLAVLANIVAILLAMTVNLHVALLALGVIALLLLYNLRLKRVPVVGNILIALLGGLTFITGGLAVDEVLTFVLPGPLIGAVFAFLFHLVREMVKDVQDLEGDRRIGIRTVPQIIGVRSSLSLALLLFFVLVVLTYIPILGGWFGTCYRIITVYVIDLPLLLLLILLWGNPSPSMLRIGSAALKIGMGLGLVALVLRNV